MIFSEKNLQGDIVGVLNGDGVKVISYSYDAWGNVTTTILGGVMETVKAILYTPITYRGYMYDFLLGLYYLQSRYYNPTYGRFLNADTTEILEATQGTPLGANLFAYCNNNPVNYVDYTGRSVVGKIILRIVGVIIFLYLAYIKWKTSPFYTFYELYDKTYNYFTPFYVHAQNIVEYGTNVNLNPVYPDYYKLGIDKTYIEVCQEAYKTAVEFGCIKTNQYWDSMSDEQKFTFTAAMLAYDRNTYYKILLVYMVELIGWGVGQVIGFMSPKK